MNQFWKLQIHQLSRAELFGLVPIALFSLLLSFCLLAESPLLLWKEMTREERKVVRNVVPVKEEVAEQAELSPLEPSASSDLAPESFAMSSLIGGSGSALGSGLGGVSGSGNGISAEALKASQSQRRASVLSRGELIYPAEARRKGISGFVDIRILVGSSGQVESVQVEKANPAGVFEKAALSAVRSWKFSPELQEGKVVAGWIRQRIRYDLQSN